MSKFQNPWFRARLLLLVLMAILTVLFGRVCWREFLIRGDLAQTTGVVLAASITSYQSNVQLAEPAGQSSAEYFSPVVAFTYAVNGVQYSGNRFELSERGWGNRQRLEGMLAHYPPNSATVVWYRRSNPEFAVLRRDLALFPWLVLGGALLSFAGLIWFELRRRAQVSRKGQPGLRIGLEPIVVCLLFVAVTSPAQSGMGAAGTTTNALPRKFKSTPPQAKILRVEHVYHFTRMSYDPPIVIRPIFDRKETVYDTPEDALHSHFSAMLKGDAAWFESTWSKASQQMNKESDAKDGHTAEFWQQTWKKILTGRQVRLSNRIESGPYVFIEYQLVSDKDGQTVFEDTVALMLEGKKWVLTQEMAADPVPVFWKTPEKQIEKVVR